MAAPVASTTIDWGGARVHDSTLTVALSEAPSKDWKRRFRGVLAMLDRSPGEWEAIELRHGRIRVANVREGAEDKLRHLLESAIVEVNGDLSAGGATADPERDASRARDLRMTQAFRQMGGLA